MAPQRPGRLRPAVVVAALAAGLLLAGAWWQARSRPAEPAPLRLEASSAPAGFARALEPRPFTLPADHGPHLEFQTEWWYYTGNLTTEAGQHVGFQLTFFRRGLSPEAVARASSFATNQVYFAHFAVTDVDGGKHTSAERFSRGAAGLAGATGEPYRVWLEDWRVEALNADGSEVRLVARQDDLALDLTLRSVKPIVAHGDAGLSPKSEAPGNASYYLSYTRLAAAGTASLHGQPVAVEGQAWFDHEWSTSALAPGAIGWDWFSLQLDDGREIMYFQIRRDDGSLEPVSGGTLVEADGTTRRLAAADVTIDVLDQWRSPTSGASYPSRWRVSIPSAGLVLEAEPWLADQEMDVSFVYWEGAVRLRGSGSAGQAIAGQGYIEMTGYAASIAGQF